MSEAANQSDPRPDTTTDPPAMPGLSGFQRDLLYAIAALDQPHGLAIKAKLADYYRSEIHHSRLYPNLDALVDKGLVEKGEIDQRTNSYTLTAAAEAELRDRRAWEDDCLADAGVLDG